MQKNRLKFDGTILFIIGLIFIDLFGFNPDRMVDSQVTRNLLLPSISLNITITMFILSIIAITICIIENRLDRRVPSNLMILVGRTILYFFPLLYMQGNFKIGVAYAMTQCAFSYYIGSCNTMKYKTVLNLLIVLIVGLSIEVFSVIYLNNLSIFASNIKWYMVIPIGKSNYITCVIIPIYVAAVEYYGQKVKPIIMLTFTAFIFTAILATSSKFALVLFIGFWIIKILKALVKNRQIKRKIFIRNISLMCLFVFGVVYTIIIYNTQVSIILDRFSVSTLFSNRINVYKETIELIFENLFFGRSAYSYQAFDVVKAHNWLLESLVQTGLIGTILYLYAIYFCVCIIRRIKQEDIRKSITTFLIIYLFHGLEEPNLFGVLSDALFWLMMGVAFSVYKNEEKII